MKKLLFAVTLCVTVGIVQSSQQQQQQQPAPRYRTPLRQIAGPASYKKVEAERTRKYDEEKGR